MPPSDGTRLNLAAELAQVAADLQKAISARSRAGADPVLVDALGDVKAAVRELSSAVRKLAAEIEEEPPGEG